MERLTEHSKQTSHENGICCTHFRGPECLGVGGNCAMNCKWEEAAWSRLAAYEDTERLPEEIAAMQHTLDEYHKVADPLLRAQADDRLVVLPCKVGDTLYEVTGRKTISEYRVKAIRVELFCVFIEWEIEKGFVWQSLAGITPNEIGKTVFLTREEAKRALEAMKDV